MKQQFMAEYALLAYSRMLRSLLILLQLFGMIEVKRPGPSKSRQAILPAQAQSQFLGVNYIVFQCITQQPCVADFI